MTVDAEDDNELEMTVLRMKGEVLALRLACAVLLNANPALRTHVRDWVPGVDDRMLFTSLPDATREELVKTLETLTADVPPPR